MAVEVTANDEGTEAELESRRKFLTRAVVAVAGAGVAFTALPFIESWLPAERARALGAPAHLDTTKIDPGQMVVIVWRRQPIYVVHRTDPMLARLGNHDDRLKDPDSSESDQPAYARNMIRARRPQSLVVIGICTHLGCLPKARFDFGTPPELGADWPGGFFCPCHGSRFDLAGRVFKGSPASINLRIPPYAFAGENELVVGVDDVATT